jgi:hypothetical protein
VSSATRTALRSGPILELEIFAAPLEMIMAEEVDILSIASHLVKALLIMLIQVTIIQNLDAKNDLQCLIQNVLQAIQISVAALCDTMEVALGHYVWRRLPMQQSFLFPSRSLPNWPCIRYRWLLLPQMH